MTYFTMNRSYWKNFALFNLNIIVYKLFYIHRIRYKSVLRIFAIHTHDTAPIYLKQSKDNEICCVPFRKPKASLGSLQDYYSETDCITVHSVCSMLFGSDELSFISAGNYPRSIEVSKDTEIISNDCIFEVKDYLNNELNIIE